MGSGRCWALACAGVWELIFLACVTYISITIEVYTCTASTLVVLEAQMASIMKRNERMDFYHEIAELPRLPQQRLALWV